MINGDFLLTICAKALKEAGQLKDDTLVVTVMSNLGLDIAAKREGINLVKTKVGDRYVLEEMLKDNYVLGGEQSGHIIFLDHNTTGDGLAHIVNKKSPLIMFPFSSTAKHLSASPSNAKPISQFFLTT